jgi:hypothetical protein
MNLQGTPGRTKVVPVDPNNQRIDFESPPGLVAGTYNEVTVDSAGRVVSGKFVASPAPAIIPIPISQSAAGLEARSGDYLGGTPNWIPANGAIGIAIDVGSLGNNRIWWYISGVWQ